jgi:hypothetical protein
MWANKRPGVDAGWAVLFAFQRPWPGTTQHGRYAPAAAAFDATLLDAAKSSLR